MCGSVVKKSLFKPEAGVDRLALDRCAGRSALRTAIRRALSGKSRSRTKCAVPGHVTQKNVLRKGIVEHTPAAPDHGSPFPGQVICEGQARSKVVVVGIV